MENRAATAAFTLCFLERHKVRKSYRVKLDDRSQQFLQVSTFDLHTPLQEAGKCMHTEIITADSLDSKKYLRNIHYLGNPQVIIVQTRQTFFP